MYVSGVNFWPEEQAEYIWKFFSRYRRNIETGEIIIQGQ